MRLIIIFHLISTDFLNAILFMGYFLSWTRKIRLIGICYMLGKMRRLDTVHGNEIKAVILTNSNDSRKTGGYKFAWHKNIFKPEIHIIMKVLWNGGLWKILYAIKVSSMPFLLCSLKFLFSEKILFFE